MAMEGETSMPKKAPSGYFLWLNEHRAEIVKALGGTKKVSEVSKKAGEMWKAMSEEEQAPYMQKSKDLKAEVEASKPQKEKRVEKENIRKKPMTPVFAFIQEKREEIAAMPDVKGLGDISKKGAELYKQLPEAEQAARKKRYEEEVKSYNEWKATDDGQAALADKKDAAAEKRQAKKDRLEKKAAKNARKAAKEARAAGVEPEEGEAATPVAARGRGRKSTGSPIADALSSGKKAKAPRSATSGGVGSAKKPRGRGRGAIAETNAPDIEPEILKEAQGLGFESALKNLAGRQEIVSSGKSAKEMLAALKKSDGLVNPAKRALLGA